MHSNAVASSQPGVIAIGIIFQAYIKSSWLATANSTARQKEKTRAGTRCFFWSLLQVVPTFAFLLPSLSLPPCFPSPFATFPPSLPTLCLCLVSPDLPPSFSSYIPSFPSSRPFSLFSSTDLKLLRPSNSNQPGTHRTAGTRQYSQGGTAGLDES